ncbi:MAG: hypothetical protein NT027_12190 [Proteobacteria bacterium]|nr:hypothetical protein [Pseudomonadota bacterium]
MIFRFIASGFIFLSTLASTQLIAQSESKTSTQSDKETAETRAIMAQIFSSLTRVLPKSMNMNDFNKQENRASISADLKQMSDSSSALIKHAKGYDRSFAFVAKSMARDLVDINRWYQNDSASEARYMLHQLSENCVSCHMKLPDPGHAPKMEQFFKDVSIANLSLGEKAKLQVALRQFDDAIKTWEEMFTTLNRPGDIYAMDALTEYLKVVLRVKQDPDRAIKTLDLINARADVPKFMVREVASWKSSLKKLKPEISKTGNELTRAAKILKSARQNMDYPMDRSSLVDYIVASTLLNKQLNTAKSKPNELSEAYYLLGTTESLIGRNAWLTQTDFYYESAIRSAPKTKFAALAYDALEQQIILEYSGSSGTSIPEDISSNLKELRNLVRKE